MDVFGQLRNAQLEVSETDPTQTGRITFKDSDASVQIGDGGETKKLFPLNVSTIQEFRSAMYPTGTMITSTLELSEFQSEMGSDWMNVKDMLKVHDGGSMPDGKVLIPPTSALGIILIARAVTTYTVGGEQWPEWTSPEGRYLRVSGTYDSTAYANEEELEQLTAANGLATVSSGAHTHTININSYQLNGTIGQTPSTNESSSEISTDAAGDHTHSITGDSETRPKSVSYNLYLKVY